MTLQTETALPPPLSALDASAWRSLIVGIDTLVPTLDGSTRPYINLDNAASTPPLRHPSHVNRPIISTKLPI